MGEAESRVRAGAEGAAAAPSRAEHYTAVRQLFREHNRALVQFLLTRLSSQQEALDVAQEAYVRLLELDRPGTIGFLRGYLFRIAANLSTDRIRRRGVRERAAMNMKLFDELSDAGEIEQKAITRQEFDAVCAALDELPPKCQFAFVRQVVEGYSTHEVAQQIGLRDRMVRNYVARALLHCRRRMTCQNTNKGRPE